MDTLGIILGVLIFGNLSMNVITKNWCAICGWLVAGLEWLRRLS